MDTVIVPLDGSELSERAIGYGKLIAATCGGSVQLLYVTEESLLKLPRVTRTANQAAAEQYLQDVRDRLLGNVPVETTVVAGDPTEEILNAAADTSDASIVMSTHGRGGLGRVMHGSVADKVLRNAPVPVTLVRSSLAPPPAIGTIGISLDGSELAEEGLPVAIDLARRAKALLVLVRVIEPYWQEYVATGNALSPEFSYLDPATITELEEQSLNQARSYLAQLAGRLREQGLRVTWEVRTGHPANEIIRLAETFPTDLVIMATHGYGGIRRWAVGSVTSESIHRGTVPVMVIPPRLPMNSTRNATAKATT